MSDPTPDPREREDPAVPASGDDEYAQAYSEGYGEGVREALREVLQHASRGHTAQELRFLIESRLARIREDIDLKRKSLVRPPRRAAWGSLLRSPSQPPASVAATGSVPLGPAGPGTTVLFRDERPRRALELLGRSHDRFPRIIVVSANPPELPPAVEDKVGVVRVAPRTPDPGSPGLSPAEIAGRLREATEAPGGALVYLDAIEFLSVEYSPEAAIRFANWATTQVGETDSALIASVDPRALEAKELSRLQRAFHIVP